MKLQNGIKKFLVILAAVYISAPLSFAYEADPAEVAAESELYVEGGLTSIGQHRGAANIAGVGGTQCNRLKKLNESFSAPLISDDVKQSRSAK